jgi:hypothetical protein
MGPQTPGLVPPFSDLGNYALDKVAPAVNQAAPFIIQVGKSTGYIQQRYGIVWWFGGRFIISEWKLLLNVRHSASPTDL